jgi:hypothetical protein
MNQNGEYFPRWGYDYYTYFSRHGDDTYRQITEGTDELIDFSTIYKKAHNNSSFWNAVYSGTAQGHPPILMVVLLSKKPYVFHCKVMIIENSTIKLTHEFIFREEYSSMEHPLAGNGYPRDPNQWGYVHNLPYGAKNPRMVPSNWSEHSEGENGRKFWLYMKGKEYFDKPECLKTDKERCLRISTVPNLFTKNLIIYNEAQEWFHEYDMTGSGKSIDLSWLTNRDVINIKNLTDFHEKILEPLLMHDLYSVYNVEEKHEDTNPLRSSTRKSRAKPPISSPKGGRKRRTKRQRRNRR